MMEESVDFFPDTNLFVQCRGLRDLPWDLWKELQEVRLIVSRPVQAEIDDIKSRASGRLGRKAREASSLLREIILGVQGFELVRDGGPRVIVLVDLNTAPDPTESARLDYTKKDDQLVGTVSAFSKANPTRNVRLLTHDTGPMMSAKVVEVQVVAIPDHWLLDPETSEAEKRAVRLEQENARLRKAEPEFQIRFFGEEDKETEKLEIVVGRYEALSRDQVNELMSQIKGYFPESSDFGPRETVERDIEMPGIHIPGLKQVYLPALDEDIEAYKTTKYPEWLVACEDMLCSCHAALEQRAVLPSFRFVASNKGTRPGRDVLVVIEAKGGFKIAPLNEGEDDDQEVHESKFLALPPPPRVPNGEWQSAFGGRKVMDSMMALNRSIDLMGLPRSFASHPPNISPSFFSAKSKHDPNAFYWKPERPMIPSESFSLTCDQWRHAMAPEWFEGTIHLDREEATVLGVIECRIHAENLSSVVSMRVPVRITVETRKAYDMAREWVDRLASGH